MTNPSIDLYQLLPTVHRLADADNGDALKQLLGIIETQLAALQEDVDQLYDDQFIETCAEWVTPYIGDLIGYRSLNDTGNGGPSSRAEVANTIGYRRRKGTLTILEELAGDVTAWGAHAVEFFERLITSQYMNHPRLHSAGTVNLRKWKSVANVGSAFDRNAHSPEMRRIGSSSGRFNIPAVGIFLWRLSAQPLRRSQAARLDAHRFAFSPLGNDTTLITNPRPEQGIAGRSGPLSVADPIRYRAFAERPSDFYGPGLSVFVEVEGVDTGLANIRVCNLADMPAPPAAPGTWARSPLQPTPEYPQRIAIDPELGRLVFADPQPVDRRVFVTYHYAASAPMGGGEYFRGESFESTADADQRVQGGESLQTAIDALAAGGLVEIAGNSRIEENLNISLVDTTLELRAIDGSRPLLVASAPVEIVLNGATLILNGLLISGAALRVYGSGRLLLRHCTLVPGTALNRDGTAVDPGAPSLLVESDALHVDIRESIVGPVFSDARSGIVMENSIVDATARFRTALAGVDGTGPGGEVRLLNCTVIGKVHTRCFTSASNSLLDAELASDDTWSAPLVSVQTQTGCLRFSYVPPGSITPRRHRCQPDLAASEAARRLRSADPLATPAALEAVRRQAFARVRPAFSSRRYGDAAYLQLNRCAAELRAGADDEAEMGAFHDVFAPQRESNLRIRLEEYLRFRLEAGMFFSS